MSEQYTSVGDFAKDCARRELSGDWGDYRDEYKGEDGRVLHETYQIDLRVTEKQFLQQLAESLKLGELRAINPINNEPFDPNLPNADASDPALLLGYTERVQAWKLLGQWWECTECGHHSSGLFSSRDIAATMKEKRERQARGFYTLREAGQLLADTHELDAAKLLWQLISAAENRQLLVRDPATQAPVLDGHRVSGLRDWVTPNDIDALLRDVWTVLYRFPANGAAVAASGKQRLSPRELKERDRQIVKMERELKKQGVRDWQKQVAAKFGLKSTSSVRAILEKKKKGSPAATPYLYQKSKRQ